MRRNGRREAQTKVPERAKAHRQSDKGELAEAQNLSRYVDAPPVPPPDSTVGKKAKCPRARGCLPVPLYCIFDNLNGERLTSNMPHDIPQITRDGLHGKFPRHP